MITTSDNVNFSESIVAFVDILGFSQAVTNDSHKINEFYKLINSLQSLSTPSETCITNGDTYVTVPVITQFSDCICISISPLEEKYKNIPAQVKFHFMNVISNIIGKITKKALFLGFLVRGGISYGEIYHNNGIIFGKAFLKAYELERDIADVPRILISDKVVEAIGQRNNFESDIDNRLILDNLSPLGIPEDESKNDIDWRGKKYAQLVKFNDIINNTIQELINNKANFKIINKWLWFQSKFNVKHGEFISLYKKSNDFNFWK